MRKSITLVAVASTVYGSMIYLSRGYLSPSIPSTLSILVPPVVILAIIFYWDLLLRARVSSSPVPKRALPQRRLGQDVQMLSKQIQVATSSSADYYDTVLVNRLRDALVERVSVQTGMDPERVRLTLSDPMHGPAMLHDPLLYHLLYTERPSKGQERVRMIDMIVDKIDGWKP